MKNHLIFTAIVMLVLWPLSYLLPQVYRTPALPFIVLFFFALNSMVQLLLIRVSEQRFSRFVNYFLAATFIKLLIYIIVVITYVFLNKGDALPFAVTFLLIYIIFTVFEVLTLLGTLRNSDSRNKPRS